MSVRQFCTQHVASVQPSDTVYTAARRMAEENVGALVVIGDRNRPMGIVTDRDIVVRALAKGLPVIQTEVRAVMTPKPVCIGDEAELSGALEMMKFHRLRRLIVVNRAQEVVGVISLDDIFSLIAEERQALEAVTETMRATRYKRH